MLFWQVASIAGCVRSFILVHWTLAFLATPARTINKTRLNLPISSTNAFPFFSVNEEFAQYITSRDPNMKILPLPSSVPSSLITATNGDLHPSRIIEVPITWNTGNTNRFQMLVVPDLSHSIVFGHNHLKKTKAIIDHDSLQIIFKHSNMNFFIQCRIKSDNLAKFILQQHDDVLNASHIFIKKFHSFIHFFYVRRGGL